MIVPMPSKIDFAAIGRVPWHRRGFAVALLVDRGVAPSPRASLRGPSVRPVLAGALPADRPDDDVPGPVAPAVAPRAASMSARSRPTDDDPSSTSTSIAANGASRPFASAPLAGPSSGLPPIPVPETSLADSGVHRVVAPVAVARNPTPRTAARHGRLRRRDLADRAAVDRARGRSGRGGAR